MSLDPSPLSSQPTPLLHPTDPLPGRGSALIGALFAVLLAGIVVFVSLRFGSTLLFAPTGLKTLSNAVPATSPYHVQGFDFYWRKGIVTPTGTAGGYEQTDTVNQVLQSEATDYHMNLAVITITLDQTHRDAPGVRPDKTIQVQTNGPDTYPDAVYSAAAASVRAAGMTPAFKLELRVTIPGGDGDFWPGNIGNGWAFSSTGNGRTTGVLAKEQFWFDSYTDVAVHYAQLAQKSNVPFFIFGSNLAQLTSDTADTLKSTDGGKTGDGNVRPWPGDTTYTCNGRRECGWRHVIAAIRGAQYMHADGKTTAAGGGYTGKLIYAATTRKSDAGAYEWEQITWWDAVDLIGMDAYFPLLSSAIALSPETIAAAWNGQGTQLSPAIPANGGLVGKLQALSQRFHRLILFTSVGYFSVARANNGPPGATVQNPGTNQVEQRADMQGLLQAFDQEPWWVGVIWTADYPFLPRSAVTETIDPYQQSWAYNTQWAGDCLTSQTCQNPEKQAGEMLREYYHTNPIPPNA